MTCREWVPGSAFQGLTGQGELRRGAGRILELQTTNCWG